MISMWPSSMAKKSGVRPTASPWLTFAPAAHSTDCRLNVVLVDGEDQRRVAVAVDVVDRRACGAQHRDRLVVAVLASDEQRRRFSWSMLVDGEAFGDQ